MKLKTSNWRKISVLESKPFTNKTLRLWPKICIRFAENADGWKLFSSDAHVLLCRIDTVIHFRNGI